MSLNRIYLDHHSTTPVDPRVLEAMLPYFTQNFGNAASRTHAFGREASEAVEEGRRRVADLVGAQPREIVFTSGATESDNLALLGVSEFYGQKRRHLVTARTEHHAVLDCCRFLETRGFRVTYLPVDSGGLVDPDDLRRALSDETLLISLMFANHEIGTIHGVSEIGQIAKEKGVFFHCDATQGVGKEPIDVESLGIDLLSFSAHKLYGPKGVGALYVRRKNPRVRLKPLFHGGGHERSLRSGTLNVPAIVGFGAACALAATEMGKERERLLLLRDLLQRRLSQVDESRVNGHPTRRLAGNLNITFPAVDAGRLLARLQSEIALSSGSACTSAVPEPSYILRAIGLSPEMAQSTLRIGLGRFNTWEEIDYAAGRLIEVIGELRRKRAPARGFV